MPISLKKKEPSCITLKELNSKDFTEIAKSSCKFEVPKKNLMSWYSDKDLFFAIDLRNISP